MDEYAQDDFAFGILNGVVTNKRYIVKEGLILKMNRVFITLMYKAMKKVLYALPNIPIMGYLGIMKTY